MLGRDKFVRPAVADCLSGSLEAGISESRGAQTPQVKNVSDLAKSPHLVRGVQGTAVFAEKLLMPLFGQLAKDLPRLIGDVLQRLDAHVVRLPCSS